MIESPPTLADLWLALSLFRDPIATAVIAGAVLGYLSVFVVLRRMVFATAALSQSAGLGVAVSFLAGMWLGRPVEPLLGAVGVSLLAAWVLSRDARVVNLSQEAVLAAVWLAGSAGSVLVGARIAQEAHDIQAILFGSAVLVRPLDFALVAAIGLAVFTTALVSTRTLIYAGFDPQGAQVQGLPVRSLELGFVIGLTLFVSVTTRALGALPVLAFAVLPGMAGLLLAHNVRTALLVATLAGAASGGLGFLAAFVIDLPVGPTQAAVALLLALVCGAVRRLRG